MFKMSKNINVVSSINSSSEKNNTVNLPNKIEGVTVNFAILEDKTKSLQEKIQAVPVIILYKENRVVKKWSAGISFKLDINAKEISEAIKKDKEKVYRRKTN